MSREMTNKEAISNINHLIYGIVSPDIQRSLDLAIKALEEIDSFKNAYRIMADAFESEVKKNTRPQGEWIIIDDVYCVCPFCKNKEVKFSKYCPECGAILKSVEKST